MPPGYEGEKKERSNSDKDDSDFNLNVGRVIETLRQDYPRLFFEPLDFDIYTPDMQLRDPVSSARIVRSTAVRSYDGIVSYSVFCGDSGLQVITATLYCTRSKRVKVKPYECISKPKLPVRFGYKLYTVNSAAFRP